MRAIEQGAKAPPAGEARQASFARVAPLIAAALVIGVVGGFALAATLTVTRALGVTGLWWAAAAQAHGHLQLYGWAGLFVLGVALHFVPRLRGAPLVGARWIPAILWAQAGSLALRKAAVLPGTVRSNVVAVADAGIAWVRAYRRQQWHRVGRTIVFGVLLIGTMIQVMSAISADY